jgi:hypothetical protein
LDNVVGYDTLNEPHNGWIGCPDLREQCGDIVFGSSPTPYEAMLLGAGYPQEVGVYRLGLTGLKQVETELVNPEGVGAWLEGHQPVWKANGVWDVGAGGEPVLLRPHHFGRIGERRVNFYRDYFRPFANAYAEAVREVEPGTIIFVEGLPDGSHIPWTEEDAEDVVHAGHWYDGITLFTKEFRPWGTLDLQSGRPVLGRRKVQESFDHQVANVKRASEAMGNAPTLIGEFGIPYDMHEAEAYRTGDFSRQVQAMDANFRAMEANLVSCTVWNYTADNTNERGDQWNGEDLSIFSRDQQTGTGSLHDGGRALDAVVRPYARAVAGEPLAMAFDPKHRVFVFEFRHDPGASAPTEFFIPRYQYPDDYGVEVSDGYYEMDPENQRLIYHHNDLRPTHRVVVWDPGLGRHPEVRAEEQRKRLITAGVLFGVAAFVGAAAAAWFLTRKEEGE